MLQNYLGLSALPESFYVGAVVILVYQAAKFGELNLADPLTHKYISYIPNIAVRDLAGRFAYYFALAVFIILNIAIYIHICNISPEVLRGALKAFTGNEDAGKGIKDSDYPLYIAAAFIGLTQPITPFLSRIGSAHVNFFHKQINVPGNVVELSESVSREIVENANGNKNTLKRKIKTLLRNPFRKDLEPFTDNIFFAAQLDRLQLGNDDEVDDLLDEASVRELKELIERIATLWFLSIMRKSGPNKMRFAAEKMLGKPHHVENNSQFLGSFIIASFIFFLVILLIAHFLDWLREPVLMFLNKDSYNSLWPKDLDFVGKELWIITSAFCICIFTSLYIYSRFFQKSVEKMNTICLFGGEIIEFARIIAVVLIACYSISFVIYILAAFYDYGEHRLPPDGSITPFAKIVIFSVRSLVPTMLCFWTLHFIASRSKNIDIRMWRHILILLLTVGGLSFLASRTFLQLDYFKIEKYGKYIPGYDHSLFAVVASILVALSVFIVIVLLFSPNTREQNVQDVIQL